MSTVFRSLVILVFFIVSLASFLLSFTPRAFAETAAPAFDQQVVLEEGQGEHLLGKHLSILEDPTQTLTLEDVRSPAYADRFVASQKEVPSFGFSASAYWIKFEIKRQTAQTHDWILEFGYAPMQSIQVFTLRQDKLLAHLKGGMEIPFSERIYRYHKHLFPLDLSGDETTQVYLRLQSESSINIPLRLFRADTFVMTASNEKSALTLYCGIILGLLFYNVFILYSIREASYFYYIIFQASFLTAMMGINGITQTLPFFADTFGIQVIPFSIGLASLCGILFAITFLNSAVMAPRLHVVARFFMAVCLISLILPFFVSYRTAILFSAAMALLTPVIDLSIGAVSLLKGNPAARYYLLSWFFLLIGIISVSARNFGLIPTNALTDNSMLWGSALEAILLSVALAARLRIMKEEKEHAQTAQLLTQQALNASQQEAINNKQMALDIIQKYSVKLENEVRSRTSELVDTQQKLIVSEKMAALGVFTAGIAHEINNPANFVAAGAQNAEAQLETFKTFVEELLDDETPEVIHGEFQRHFSTLGDSLSIIRTGIIRIERVVKQLRATHPEGNTGMQPADVIEAIESAWRVLSASLAYPITLDTQLDARPALSCIIAEIHQVFLALLGNAAHAIEDAAQAGAPDYRGRLRLSSQLADGMLIIMIADNGIGIPADKMDKIFDPFFTTKTVGRGAGLGLSMARDVVKRHDGTIEVASVAGQGATFTVKLPVG